LVYRAKPNPAIPGAPWAPSSGWSGKGWWRKPSWGLIFASHAPESLISTSSKRSRTSLHSHFLWLAADKRHEATFSLSSKMAHPSNAFNTNPAVQVIPNGSGLGAVAAEQRRGEEQHEPRGSGRPIDGAVAGGGNANLNQRYRIYVGTTVFPRLVQSVRDCAQPASR
jgi:hypothetical protein